MSMFYIVIGCGEQLMRTMLSKYLADSLRYSPEDGDTLPAVAKLDLAMKTGFIGKKL